MPPPLSAPPEQGGIWRLAGPSWSQPWFREGEGLRCGASDGERLTWAPRTQQPSPPKKSPSCRAAPIAELAPSCFPLGKLRHAVGMQPSPLVPQSGSGPCRCPPGLRVRFSRAPPSARRWVAQNTPRFCSPGPREHRDVPRISVPLPGTGQVLELLGAFAGLLWLTRTTAVPASPIPDLTDAVPRALAVPHAVLQVLKQN